MSRKAKDQTPKDKVDAALDEALKQTFPASDPLALTEPAAANHVSAKSPKRRRMRKHPPLAI